MEPRRYRQSLGIAYTDVVSVWLFLAHAVPAAGFMGGSSLSNGETQGGSPGSCDPINTFLHSLWCLCRALLGAGSHHRAAIEAQFFPCHLPTPLIKLSLSSKSLFEENLSCYRGEGGNEQL